MSHQGKNKSNVYINRTFGNNERWLNLATKKRRKREKIAKNSRRKNR